MSMATPAHPLEGIERPRSLRTPEHRRVLVEFAQPNARQRIGELCAASGFVPNVDWRGVSVRHWLVCWWHGKIVGALCTHPGQPVGRLELLSVDPGLGLVQRGVVVRELIWHGFHYLKLCGATLAAGSIPYNLNRYTNLLVARGGRIQSHGVVVAWRL